MQNKCTGRTGDLIQTASQNDDGIDQVTKQSNPASNNIPDKRTPWRRFFARYLDGFIYSVIWFAFLQLVFNVNMSARSTGEKLLDGITIALMMLFLEPALLAWFGTTIGKYILGLRVGYNDNRRLSYVEALSRTWTMFLRGMGLNLPIYNIVRQWKSYKACVEGETLEWELNSSITLKDKKVWRIAAYISLYLIIIGVLVLTTTLAQMPRNRGDISVAEFCENYNRLSNYFGISTSCYLDEEGNWRENESSVYVISLLTYENPVYRFSQNDGIMTGMQFSIELDGKNGLIESPQQEMILSTIAFVGAQNGNTPFSNEVKRIIDTISESPFEDFELSAYGVNISCDVRYSGYIDMASAGYLIPEEDAESYTYSCSFSMQKQ
jgi:uncharacterized RDD family membrane protein YckC